MTAHGPLQQALMSQPVQPPAEPVPRGHGKHQPEVAGSARQQEPLLQRQRQLLGEALPHKPIDHDRVAVTNKPDRFGGGDDLVPHRTAGQRFRGDPHGSS